MSTVVLLMIDGTRPDAIAAAGCTHLESLRARSAYTLSASSVMPSITLPCHISIFHSVPPTRHGITTNIYIPMARPLPGLVERVRDGGKRSAFFYNWEQLRDLNRPGNLHFSYCANDCASNDDSDHATVEAAIRYREIHKPDFTFLYLGTVDEVGHRYGWMSEGYLKQLAHVDGAVGQFMASLPEDTTVLFMSDHGGHDRSHGTDMAEDMTIPWMISGPGIRQNYQIQSPVSLLDTAPTLARVLGIDPADQWEGVVPEEIFEG
ncbi:MAG: alkaline phosphatase family protein [Caldilineaceae bacterium]|nr:alkaline phosphatase family protein [Caldilineaceae bacterium]